MRKLIWLGVILTALWGAWWILAGWALERGITRWQADLRAQGVQADLTLALPSGFPMRLHQAVRKITLADPGAGITLNLDEIAVSLPLRWPGDIDVDLPGTPVTLQLGHRFLTLETMAGLAVLRLHPGAALELEQMALRSDGWTLGEVEGRLFQAATTRAEIVQGETPQVYNLRIDAELLTPGGNLRTALGLPVAWPLAFETFKGDATVRFDRPLDRHSLDASPSTPTAVEIRAVDLHWGAMRLQASGDVTIDPQGLPDGVVTLRFEAWRQALTFADRSGLLEPDSRPQVAFMLNLLANRGDDPEVLDLTLEMRDGAMSLNGLPLGPAPRLILR